MQYSRTVQTGLRTFFAFSLLLILVTSYFHVLRLLLILLIELPYCFPVHGIVIYYIFHIIKLLLLAVVVVEVILSGYTHKQYIASPSNAFCLLTCNIFFFCSVLIILSNQIFEISPKKLLSNLDTSTCKKNTFEIKHSTIDDMESHAINISESGIVIIYIVTVLFFTLKIINSLRYYDVILKFK